MGTKIQQGSSNGDFRPGPGAYDLKERPSSGVKMGKATRLASKEHEIPGPGTYAFEARPKSASPEISFGKAARNELKATQFPGPGSYNQQGMNEYNQKLGKGFTMKQRLNSGGKSDQVPGPGAYNTVKDITKENSRIYSFGKEKGNKELMSSGVPGPGAYEPRLNVRPASPQYKIGTAQRQNADLKNIPGPGQYNPAVPKESPQFSIAARIHQKTQEMMPGPGAYQPGFNPNIKDSSTMMGKIGKSERLRGKTDNNPGPGAYNPTLPKDEPAISFGKSGINSCSCAFE